MKPLPRATPGTATKSALVRMDARLLKSLHTHARKARLTLAEFCRRALRKAVAK